MIKKTNFNKTHPTIADRFRFLFVAFGDVTLYFVAKNYNTFIRGFRFLSPKYLDWTSRIRAKRLYYFAARKVPAYRNFLENTMINKWNDIPFTDKDTYIKKYTTEQRCVNGKIPEIRVAIDESSGSTGIPYNWVRSLRERRESHTFISYFNTFCFGKKSRIIINAFSMGSWATGTNMGIALQANGIVKNVGPDIGKILRTLEFFGNSREYLITGYPPFLKQLYDYASEQKFPWENYSLSALVGGEGMSEGLRDYLLLGFKNAYSGS